MTADNGQDAAVLEQRAQSVRRELLSTIDTLADRKRQATHAAEQIVRAAPPVLLTLVTAGTVALFYVIRAALSPIAPRTSPMRRASVATSAVSLATEMLLVGAALGLGYIARRAGIRAGRR